MEDRRRRASTGRQEAILNVSRLCGSEEEVIGCKNVARVVEQTHLNGSLFLNGFNGIPIHGLHGHTDQTAAVIIKIRTRIHFVLIGSMTDGHKHLLRAAN